VTHKSETKPSTFVKCVIEFMANANFTNILSLCLSHNNCLHQVWICVTNKFKLSVGFFTPTILIPNLTNAKGFVFVLCVTQKGSCLRCHHPAHSFNTQISLASDSASDSVPFCTIFPRICHNYAIYNEGQGKNCLRKLSSTSHKGMRGNPLSNNECSIK